MSLSPEWLASEELLPVRLKPALLPVLLSAQAHVGCLATHFPYSFVWRSHHSSLPLGLTSGLADKPLHSPALGTSCACQEAWRALLESQKFFTLPLPLPSYVLVLTQGATGGLPE